MIGKLDLSVRMVNDQVINNYIQKSNEYTTSQKFLNSNIYIYIYIYIYIFFKLSLVILWPVTLVQLCKWRECKMPTFAENLSL